MVCGMAGVPLLPARCRQHIGGIAAGMELPRTTTRTRTKGSWWNCGLNGTGFGFSWVGPQNLS
jgi:hypothetical protein